MRPLTRREIASAYITTLEHREHPEVTYDQYRQRAFQRLDAFLKPKLIVYLDTKYWVWLRDPHLAGPDEVYVRQLDKMLRDGVTKGRLICPVSFPTIAELFKQHQEVRLRTASVMDALSLGVSLKAPAEISAIELAQLFLDLHKVADNSTYIEPVWSRAGLLFGEGVLAKALPLAGSVLAQKKAFTGLWTLPIREIGSFMVTGPQLPDFASRINEERAGKPRSSYRFDQLYLAELATALDQKREMIARSLGTCFSPSGSLPNSTGVSEEIWSTFIWHTASAAIRRRGPSSLPFQRIAAALHASIRMDDACPHKNNDLEDVMHGSSALGYCDVFLTERSLAARILSSPVKDKAMWKCRVEHRPNAALGLLSDLIGSPN